MSTDVGENTSFGLIGSFLRGVGAMGGGRAKSFSIERNCVAQQWRHIWMERCSFQIKVQDGSWTTININLLRWHWVSRETVYINTL